LRGSSATYEAARAPPSLPNATNDTALPANNEWVVQSDTVKQKTVDGSISGGGVDPDSGTEGSGQLTVQWKFSEVGSVSSTFTVVEQAQLHDYGNQIVANLPWLVSEASSVGMASDGEISQGFGVVTSVLLASCGLNLGSEIKTSTFAISGSAEASNAMAGNAKGSVAGSYSETGQTASFEQHLWPATSGGPATTNVPIAFQFASFIYGNQLIVGWITDVSDIEIELADDHGGTYIVDAQGELHVSGPEPVGERLGVGRAHDHDATLAHRYHRPRGRSQLQGRRRPPLQLADPARHVPRWPDRHRPVRRLAGQDQGGRAPHPPVGVADRRPRRRGRDR
jgi:hypothetical protein